MFVSEHTEYKFTKPIIYDAIYLGKFLNNK